jgi:GntR family transcriptional regulator
MEATARVHGSAIATASERAARSLPAYLRIEEEIGQRIEAGELAPGVRLPPERELADSLGVSRMTLRAALARLEQRGLIVRRQGSGTVVGQPKLRQDTSHLRGFFESSLGQGVVPRTRVIERAELGAGPHVADALGLRPDERVYKVVRVRSARGVPVVLETSYFPTSIVPGLLDHDLERASIYRLMERDHDARPVRATQTLEPVAAGRAESAVLEVAVGSPIMLVERTAWDARGRPVEHARDLYRGDRSRFVGDLTL